MPADTTIERTLQRAGTLAKENERLRAQLATANQANVEVCEMATGAMDELAAARAQLAAAQGALARVPTHSIGVLIDYGMPLGVDSASWRIARDEVAQWIAVRPVQGAGEG